MITKNEKQKFLEILREMPNIYLACKRTSISKATIYRWRKADTNFNNSVLEALNEGREAVTDLAESVIVTHMKKGSMRAAEFWLNNNEKRYIKPRLPLPREDHQCLTQFNVILTKNKETEKDETYSGVAEKADEVKKNRLDIIKT